MTANAIVGKLNVVLTEPVDSECKVVYILCETRKLLGGQPAAQRPFALNMYCHWALHVDLHGKDTIEPFLKQVDNYVHSMLEGPEDVRASHRMIREFVFLDAFRSQLREFWQRHGVDTGMVDDDTRWREFVSHYAGVIEDGTLAFRSPAGLQHVAGVRFEKGRDNLGEFTHLPFEMVWVVSLADGREAKVKVSVRPPQKGAGKMIATAFSLS